MTRFMVIMNFSFTEVSNANLHNLTKLVQVMNECHMSQES